MVGDACVISDTVLISGALIMGTMFPSYPAGSPLLSHGVACNLISECLVFTHLLGAPTASNPTADTLRLSRTGSALQSFCQKELGLDPERAAASKAGVRFLTEAESPQRPRTLAMVAGQTEDGNPLVRVFMRGITSYVLGAVSHMALERGPASRLAEETKASMASFFGAGSLEGTGWSCALAYKDVELDAGGDSPEIGLEPGALDEVGFTLIAVFAFSVPVRNSCSILAFRCKNLGIRLHHCSESEPRVAHVVASKMGLVGEMVSSGELQGVGVRDVDEHRLLSVSSVASCDLTSMGLFVRRLRAVPGTVVAALTMNEVYAWAVGFATFAAIQPSSSLPGTSPGAQGPSILYGFNFDFMLVGGFMDVFSVVEAIRYSKTRALAHGGSFLPIAEESLGSSASLGSQRLVPSWNKKPYLAQGSSGQQTGSGASLGTSNRSGLSGKVASPTTQSPWQSPLLVNSSVPALKEGEMNDQE